MAEQDPLTRESKGWKFRISRVADGYVRLSVSSDDPDELIYTWQKLHTKLEELGEHVEKVTE